MYGLAPSLVDNERVLGEASIPTRIVIHGLTGPIKVNGQSWSLHMPPLGAVLNDLQVAGVLTYIRREWEHGADPITVTDVVKIREAYKTRTGAWTADELGFKKRKKRKNYRYLLETDLRTDIDQIISQPISRYFMFIRF